MFERLAIYKDLWICEGLGGVLLNVHESSLLSEGLGRRPTNVVVVQSHGSLERGSYKSMFLYDFERALESFEVFDNDRAASIFNIHPSGKYS